MRPSWRAEYAAAVAEMANCTLREAENDIPMAKGLQLHVLWWAKPRGMANGVACLKLHKGVARKKLRRALGHE